MVGSGMRINGTGTKLQNVTLCVAISVRVTSDGGWQWTMKTTTPMIPYYYWCHFSLELVSPVLKPELLIDCIMVDHMTYSNIRV